MRSREGEDGRLLVRNGDKDIRSLTLALMIFEGFVIMGKALKRNAGVMKRSGGPYRNERANTVGALRPKGNSQ